MVRWDRRAERGSAGAAGRPIGAVRALPFLPPGPRVRGPPGTGVTLALHVACGRLAFGSLALQLARARGGRPARRAPDLVRGAGLGALEVRPGGAGQRLLVLTALVALGHLRCLPARRRAGAAGPGGPR